MIQAIQHSEPTTNQRFTVSEEETDIADAAVIARTKRYAFYWLLGEEPILIRVLDYDGTNVTDEVEPPDGMRERLAQRA